MCTRFAKWHRRSLDDLTFLSFFKLLDADNNRGIQAPEYDAFLENPLYYLQFVIKARFLTLDVNGDGQISLSEAQDILVDAYDADIGSIHAPLSHADLSLCISLEDVNGQGQYIVQGRANGLTEVVTEVDDKCARHYDIYVNSVVVIIVYVMLMQQVTLNHPAEMDLLRQAAREFKVEKK